MSVKASISLTKAQEAFARQLVAEGRYSSLSAVLQQGLELMQEKSRTDDALAEVLRQRQSGLMVSLETGRHVTREMIARKRADRGL